MQRMRGHNKSIGWRDDFAVKPKCTDGDLHGDRSVAHRHAMLHTQSRSNPGFQFLYKRSVVTQPSTIANPVGVSEQKIPAQTARVRRLPSWCLAGIRTRGAGPTRRTVIFVSIRVTRMKAFYDVLAIPRPGTIGRTGPAPGPWFVK